MAKLPNFVEKFIQWLTQKGGLSSDQAAEDISNGNLYLTIPETGALNVRAVGEDTNESPDYEPIVGNELVYQFDAPVVQNNINRIDIIYIAATTYKFQITFPSGIIVTTGVIAAGGNLAATYANMSAAILAAMAAATLVPALTISALVTGTATTGYFTVENTYVPFSDMKIESVITGVTNLTQARIIQEAIDVSMLGYWREIGSDDRTGDLFQFWTTRTTYATIIADILTITPNGFGDITITTVLPHNLVANQSVLIQGAPANTNANGIWIIVNVTANTFDLNGSTWVNNGATGTVTTNVYGYGMITAAVKNENDQTWTGTILLRSKEFNFTDLKQIDCRAKRKQDLNIAVYFTDDYNPYRVFYYKGAYITDGALTVNGGNYDYGEIAAELILDITATEFDLIFVSQIQSGGNVRSGNWRYAARFGTQAGLSFTNWGFLTNPIPVANADEAGTANIFFGDPAGLATVKQNILSVTNPLPGVFFYVEIAAINYLDSGYTGEIIGRYVLTGANPQQIIHTGFELNVTDLDIGTLNNFKLSIKHGRNIELLNNHLIKSNLTLNTIPDLSTWFETWEHSLGYETMDTTGNYNLTQNTSIYIGEYQLSDNVYRITGHQLLETYRYGAVVEFTDGSESPTYWIDDIIFSTGNVNNVNTSNPAFTDRRITGLVDYDLTDNSVPNCNARSFYVEFSGFDLDAIVDGVSVRSVVKRIRIMRAERTIKTVLASGVAIAAVSGTVASGAVGGSENLGWYDGVSADKLGEFPLVGGFRETGTVSGLPINYAYGQAGAFSDFVVQPTWAAIYFVDQEFGHTLIASQANFDQIINLGQPSYDVANNLIVAHGQYPDNRFYDYILETNGFTNVVPVTLTVVEGKNIGMGSNDIVGGTQFYKHLNFGYDLGFFPDSLYDAPDSLVVKMSGALNRITAFGGQTDRGLRQIIYKRPLTIEVQYGDHQTTKYVWTGRVIDITTTTASPFPVGTHVFGGDVFTQRTYLKNRYPLQDPPTGFGQGLAFFAQNVINYQMRINAGNGTFPSIAPQTWLKRRLIDAFRPPDEDRYNEGYTIRNEIQSYNAFDINANYQIDWGNVIAWSQPEAEGANTDFLRIFLPLDIKFEDYTYGYITEFKNENEEAIVVQRGKIVREYFNDKAVLTTKEGSEIITGDGGIMNSKGLTVTMFGSINKWSIQQGKNKRGNQVLYGVDVNNKCIWRYGYDGNDNLSEMQMIASFCKNNFQFVYGKDNPAHEQGICSFANQKFREVGWTFRGWKEGIIEWQEAFNVLHNFTTFEAFRAYSNVVQINGILYGITFVGGASTGGIIYSYNISTGAYTLLFDMVIATGRSVVGDIIAIGNKLYGTASSGGATGNGVIFSYDIPTDTYTDLHDFNGTTEGGTPLVGLLNINGILYGCTNKIFSYNISTATFTVLYSIGSPVAGNLVNIGNIIYGTVNASLFSYNITTTVYSAIVLAGTAIAGLTKSGTTLYGTTNDGGTGNYGTIFSFDTLTATLTTIYDFTNAEGANPRAQMILQNGYLVGTTQLGGANNQGVIFAYNITSGTFIVLHDFALADGIQPQSTLLYYNGVFYGTAATGGTVLGADGTLYSFTNYSIGAAILMGTQEFEEIPAFYESTVDFNITDPATSDTWKLIKYTDRRFYNFYTIVWSEIKSVFQMFVTPKYQIYANYKNTYLAPRQVGNTSMMFENARGTILRWSDDGTTAQTGEAFFDAPINVPKLLRKDYIALKYLSLKAPDQVNVTTKDHTTFMVGADMETREGETDMAVKNDSTVTLIGANGAAPNPTGSPSIDTSKLFGNYAIIRTYINTYNRINSFIVKIRYKSRLPNK